MTNRIFSDSSQRYADGHHFADEQRDGKLINSGGGAYFLDSSIVRTPGCRAMYPRLEVLHLLKDLESHGYRQSATQKPLKRVTIGSPRGTLHVG